MRKELLAALLTIWRWGRISSGIKRGRPLGSLTPAVLIFEDVSFLPFYRGTPQFTGAQARRALTALSTGSLRLDLDGPLWGTWALPMAQ
jgi:hypothetical protein